MAAVVAVFLIVFGVIERVGDRGDRENTVRLREKIRPCQTIEDADLRNICLIKLNNPYVEFLPAGKAG